MWPHNEIDERTNLGGSIMANEYRKKGESDTWHFCRNCSRWPTSGYTTRQTKPTSGELCNECKAKERDGNCR